MNIALIVPMAADHRRKRLNGSSMVVYGSPQQNRTKRKNTGLTQNELLMKSHVSVEWDGDHQRVVAKRGQIGISWRHLRPFVNYVPNGHNILADVLATPQELFGLNNLSEVLSYEVWNTLLSENERNFLMQFLPSGLEPDQVVQNLLSGDNVNFGNPFINWGTALCSGDLHPDRIVNQEQRLKSAKKAYYSLLHNYHNDMIGFLTKLKTKWESCKDPEKEIVQKLWRSKNVEKRIPSNLNEFRVYDHNGNVTATSESCSWGAEEKTHSDNQISLMGQGDKLHRRVLNNRIGKGKQRNLMASSDDRLNVGVRPKKGDKLNVHSWDDDKYMSCIKVSKKQHELYKSMKLSCKSIQSRTLSHVLGDMDNIHVQPYEVFIKEEQKKLHEHWLQLVNKHLPVAYANWTERQIQINAIRNSLVVEMKDKSKPLVEDEDIVSSGVQLIKDQDEDEGPNDQPSLEDNEDSISGSQENQSQHLEDNEDYIAGSQENQSQHLEDNEDSMAGSQENQSQHLEDNEDSIAGSQENQSQHLEDNEESIAGSQENQSQHLEDNEDSIAGSPENQSQHNSYHSCNDEENDLSMDSGKNCVLSKSDYASQNNTEYSRNTNTQDIPTGDRAPLFSDGHVWQSVERPYSFYNSDVSNEYTANGISLVNPQINEEHETQLIGLESDLHREDTDKELLHRQSVDVPFSTYQSQDQNDLLQSILKREGANSYHHEQKSSGLDFQASNNFAIGDGQFSSHFKEPLQTSLTLDQGQRRAGEVYIQETISDNTFPDGGRYLIPRQDPIPAVNIADWTVNAPRMAAPSQSQLNVNTSSFIGQQWFSTDHQARGGWNGSDGASLSCQSLGSGGSSDQSLYSILSHCSSLSSSSPHISVRPNDQFLALRTHGAADAGKPRINAATPPSSNPLDYFNGGREAPGAVAPDEMAWMNLPNENSALHDQRGKPFFRPWNR